ncbi:hypothetical protein IPG41_06545 [Candidatus Peregrinibacteria bacterium]|nr:MAG: hypothetical protein IPG41_06545 [Candidatus Peregrinibacteria bacterium]
MKAHKTTFSITLALFLFAAVKFFLGLSFWFLGMNLLLFMVIILIAVRNIHITLIKKDYLFLSINLILVVANIFIISNILKPSFTTIFKNDKKSVLSYEITTQNEVIFTKRNRFAFLLSKEECLTVLHYGFRGNLEDMNPYVEGESLFIGKSEYPLSTNKQSNVCLEKKF